jgi:hypothetical protein
MSGPLLLVRPDLEPPRSLSTLLAERRELVRESLSLHKGDRLGHEALRYEIAQIDAEIAERCGAVQL